MLLRNKMLPALTMSSGPKPFIFLPKHLIYLSEWLGPEGESGSLTIRTVCAPQSLGLMFPILWLQTQSHLSAGLHCPGICLYAPRDSSNGPIKNSIRKCFNQNTLSDITESPEFSFKIGAHRWKTLIAVVTSLVSKCILFMLCCWWNWLLMCILSILCIMNKNFKIYEKGLPSSAAVVPERQRKGGRCRFLLLGAMIIWEPRGILYL